MPSATPCRLNTSSHRSRAGRHGTNRAPISPTFKPLIPKLKQPNIPHHTDRRPTDYPRHQKPKFGWRDDNGKPIHEIDEYGNPICGRTKSKTKEPCRQTLLAANGRCAAAGHGGNHPGGPVKHGGYSGFLPTHLAAKYDKIANDDVLRNVRDNIALIVAMIQLKLTEMGEERSAEHWDKANKAYTAAKAAILARDETALYIALDELGAALSKGSGIQQKEREILDLMARSANLTKVELTRLEKMDQFMTAEQMLANSGQVLSILKKHVPPSICAKIASELGLAPHASDR